MKSFCSIDTQDNFNLLNIQHSQMLDSSYLKYILKYSQHILDVPPDTFYFDMYLWKTDTISRNALFFWQSHWPLGQIVSDWCLGIVDIYFKQIIFKIINFPLKGQKTYICTTIKSSSFSFLFNVPSQETTVRRVCKKGHKVRPRALKFALESLGHNFW